MHLATKVIRLHCSCVRLRYQPRTWRSHSPCSWLAKRPNCICILSDNPVSSLPSHVDVTVPLAVIAERINKAVLHQITAAVLALTPHTVNFLLYKQCPYCRRPGGLL